MTNIRVFITGIGIISPVGNGLEETKNTIKEKRTGIKPLTLFPVPHNDSLPAGEISYVSSGGMPRTHELALMAAKEALKDVLIPPGAVIIGSTTGGMPLTENLMKNRNFDPGLYRHHSPGSVSEYIALKIKCTGPVLTVSTACSSGGLAIKLAIELLRCGMAASVLAGGADALCRLTYHGFNSLQLIDPNGSRPLDIARKGMSVAEGAALLLLSAHAGPPPDAIAEILGAGLSCDAYHPASPHPDGTGAADAIIRALKDAAISPADIDYINLHGTGTIDNDLSEAKALHKVFGAKMPSLSSVKGATGHSLAAAGAIEAVISAISITEGIIPPNTGCLTADPALGLTPVLEPFRKEVNTVLSNSFGFGGNNAAIVIGNFKKNERSMPGFLRRPFSVIGKACLTGAGDKNATFEALRERGKCSGLVEIDRAAEILPKSKIRRLKRLPRMVLCLAEQACRETGENARPSSVCFGTGWGSLSETYDFLDKLFESGEQFPSPTDFVGSVHNAPAGQAAIWYGATGPNVTATGGDYSFEQALLNASLLSGSEDNDGTILLVGADEYHNVLSKILDGSAANALPSDGGCALLLKKTGDDPAGVSPGPKIFPSFFEYSGNNKDIIVSLIKSLGGAERINNTFDAIFAGIPASGMTLGKKLLAELQSLILYGKPVIYYRNYTGEFASASAVAAVTALESVETGKVPGVCGFPEFSLENKGILVIGLGEFVTAVEIIP